MSPAERFEALRARIGEAGARGTPLCLRGGGTKDFYGGAPRGEVLAVAGYAGIVGYEPTELVVTARGGTPLAELEQALRERGQFLPFEPPHFGAGATVGGSVACGLSGPRRATSGALRDYVLGARIVDGRGRDLSFGGQVMKNVAGYDLSRLLAGSLGTLGWIAEVSLKVLPSPVMERSLRLELAQAQAIERMNAWGGQPYPISATAWHDGTLRVRLSGTEAALRSAAAAIGGDLDPDAGAFWASLREQTHPFFTGAAEPLWRVAVPSLCPPLSLQGGPLIEWGGSLRWFRGGAEDAVREAASRAGGHATLFRSPGKPRAVFAELDPVLLRIHRSLKQVFDPAGVLNPGRLHPEL